MKIRVTSDGVVIGPGRTATRGEVIEVDQLTANILLGYKLAEVESGVPLDSPALETRDLAQPTYLHRRGRRREQ